MSQVVGKNGWLVSDQEIAYLDEMLRNINSDISGSMSYVRRAQGLTFRELGKRITGISSDTFKRYMQQSYSSMRPIHIVAEFSWIMMVPMTAFYYGFRIKEFYRGMDDHAVEALVCLGRLSANMLNTFLTMICHILSDDLKKAFFSFRERVESQYGKLEDHVYFSSEMKQFPDFYKLRKIQHVRDLLVVEALRMLSEKDRKYMTCILINLSEMYR